ncbi:hypothetical protein Q763_03840 [Flavobacterium beibuense F44-8]|uniref:MvaI/BcnI restriction endonuclease domain-containing protein n=1 Tax=Flavobacterium beibuense F44-8 TaxID=1406840 RepID=A0A0A2LS80_9FLAO|nr:MvaI/BcnI family restriction endonuclease [Flavobacterium beibuense]KGO83152.1 hypothetical protein Q763_03840 [Flavobacterium beibuense F44-8]
MDLINLKAIFSSYGCKKVYVKKLAPNDNSKNQVYLAGSFDILNIFPIKEILNEPAGDWKKERFKAKIDFSWVVEDGTLSDAPYSQLILYPKYPEVRFSGFLLRSKKAPSKLMATRLADRLLFLGVTDKGKILGYVASPDSPLAKEVNNNSFDNYGVFRVIELSLFEDNRVKLISELFRIYNMGWIKSKRLDSVGNVMVCESSNCGGYTLEAELGITPNGFSEPDFLGWEVKQFGVDNFEKINSKVITLMTPEPTHGYYKTDGAEAFIRKYGYNDLNGVPDRMNFGGIHRAGELHHRTNLRMEVMGFDNETGKIRNTDGAIVLVDDKGREAASWSFSSMLLHWNRKHNQACFVPSMSENNGGRSYKYGNKVIIGVGTDFQLFLEQMVKGNVYYDPGIKLENISTKPKVKKRSQFRVKSGDLQSLYKTSEILDLTQNNS